MFVFDKTKEQRAEHAYNFVVQRYKDNNLFQDLEWPSYKNLPETVKLFWLEACEDSTSHNLDKIVGSLLLALDLTVICVSIPRQFDWFACNFMLKSYYKGMFPEPLSLMDLMNLEINQGNIKKIFSISPLVICKFWNQEFPIGYKPIW